MIRYILIVIRLCFRANYRKFDVSRISWLWSGVVQVKFVGTGDVSEKNATIIDETDKKSQIITDDENIRRFTEVVFDQDHKPMQFDPECQNCKQNIAVYVNYNNEKHRECIITIKKASINA